MPEIISRDIAVATLEKEKPVHECLICWLQQRNDNLIIEPGENYSVILSKFPSRWGHIMVLMHPHFTSYSELPPGIWATASQKAQQAATVLEKVLNPVRCYIISAGTSRSDIPMSSPHLHINVIPVYEKNDKPSTVLTWKNGVVAASDEEWNELHQSILHAWELM